MKVKRVVINEGQLHVGVVFDTGPNTVGRAIVDLPADACAAILAAAQAEFDKGTAGISQELQSTALTAELHRLRSARQDLAIVQRDQAAAIDEHGKRIAEAAAHLSAKTEAADAVVAKAARAAAASVAEANAMLEAKRQAIKEADKAAAENRAKQQEEIEKLLADKQQLAQEIAKLEHLKKLRAVSKL